MVYFSSLSVSGLIMDYFKGESGIEYFTIGNDVEIHDMVQMELLPRISSRPNVYGLSDNKSVYIFYFDCLLRYMEVFLK